MKQFRQLLPCLFLFACLAANAQNDTARKDTTGGTKGIDNPHLRISLITCGPGYDEIYSVFGHTAVRVIDSVHHTDLVYNYGTFNGFDKDFELKFMRGKLLYYLSCYPFSEFLPEYVQAHRSVVEQELLLNSAAKGQFAEYLNWNAEPENREYKYDFFYDNCSTRIRDLFPQTITKGFVYGKCLPPNSKITFRDIINQYFYTVPWERFGINILLGSRIDKVMTDKDIMFLPDYLSISVTGATASGHKIAAPAQTLLTGAAPLPAPTNWCLITMWLVAALTVGGLSVPALKKLGKFMTAFVLCITGLLGCLILVMWYGTDHGGCHDNYNLLWALPTNIVIAFFNPKGKGRYALVALVFLVITFVLHFMRVQQVILSEFAPIFLALCYIYGSIYRKSLSQQIVANTTFPIKLQS